MLSRFDEDAQKILNMARSEMSSLKHPFVGSEHLLLAILKTYKPLEEIFNRFCLNYSDFKNELLKIIGYGNEINNWFLYTPLLKRIIEDSVIVSKEMNCSEVSVVHLLLALLEEGEGTAYRILNNLDIDIDALYDDISLFCNDKKVKSKKKSFLDDFGVDLNKMVIDKKIDPVIGRDKEITRLIEILTRRIKNNPLLIGEAGVGKTAIVEELARRIVFGNVPNELKNKRIFSLEMSSLVAGTKYRGEFEERICKLLKEVENDNNIILFIDEIHTIIGAGGAEGAIDASNILKPALSRGKIKLIGATTMDEYKKTIEKDKAFDRRFQKLVVDEPNDERTYEILLGLRDVYQSFHNVKVSDECLKTIVELTNKYVYNNKQPDKSIDILDEVCTYVKLANSKNKEKYDKYKKELKSIKEGKRLAVSLDNYNLASQLKNEESNIINKMNGLEKKISMGRIVPSITKKDVAKIVSDRTGIPVYDIDFDINKKIFTLEKELKNYIFGQDEIIKSLSDYSKRFSLGLKKDNRPFSFMFVGATGVGKTLLASKFSELFFGKNKLVRFDMSEYKEEHSISKILGSPSGYIGYSDNNNKLEEIRNNPFSVILLDEIEKAHPSVINLFLQILDEGKITDSSGKIVRFDNCIIIMTSNLGFNTNGIGFNSNKDSVKSLLNNFFNIEFINRLDEVFIFNNLSRDSITKIVKNKLSILKKEFKKKQINVSISKSIIDEIVVLSEYQKFGARRIDKVINSKVNSVIIDDILLGTKNIGIKKIRN